MACMVKSEGPRNRNFQRLNKQQQGNNPFNLQTFRDGFSVKRACQNFFEACSFVLKKPAFSKNGLFSQCIGSKLK